MRSHVVSITLYALKQTLLMIMLFPSRTDKLLSATHHKTHTMHCIHVSDGSCFLYDLHEVKWCEKMFFHASPSYGHGVYFRRLLFFFFSLPLLFAISVPLAATVETTSFLHPHTDLLSSVPLCKNICRSISIYTCTLNRKRALQTTLVWI